MSSILQEFKNMKLNKPELAIISIVANIFGVVVFVVSFILMVAKYNISVLLALVLAFAAFYIVTYFYTLLAIAVMRFLINLRDK